MERPDAVLIAGPTASGKSGLAVVLAQRLNGAVINADSMQVYEGLRILTARPAADEERGVEHHLFGHVDPRSSYSVGAWIREVEALLPVLRSRGRIPVFCGGTGLYFKALTEGLAVAPVIDPELRSRLRARMDAEGPAALHRELHRIDPAAAERIRASDPHRIVRALELVSVDGRDGVQGRQAPALVSAASAQRFVLVPERSHLREAIRVRFHRMVEAGAMAEATAYAERYGDLESLASKAIGLAELLGAARGETTLDVAIELAVTRSRQYAKRQDTWFRNQLGSDWQRFATPQDAICAGTSDRRRG